MPVIKLTLSQEYYDLVQKGAEERGVTAQDYIRGKLFDEEENIFTPREAVRRALEKYGPGDCFTLPELYGGEWRIARGVAGVFGKQFYNYVTEQCPGLIRYAGQVNSGRHASYQIIEPEKTSNGKNGGSEGEKRNE